MPFKRKYAKKRYPKRYKKRSRFSKKKFFKQNNNVRATIKSTAMPRELYVKLRWTNISTNTISAGSSISGVVNGTSIFPSSISGPFPAVGDPIISGIPEYSEFYDNYVPLGASINIRILNNQTAAVYYRCVLVAVSTSIGSGIADHKLVLDAYDYDDLASLPNAQTRILGLGTGAAAMASFKMFRKTKNMLGIKDIKDNEALKLDMPDGTTGGTFQYTDQNSWFYYFRVFNSSGAASTNVEIELKCKYYIMFSNRKTIQQFTSTSS